VSRRILTWFVRGREGLRGAVYHPDRKVQPSDSDASGANSPFASGKTVEIQQNPQTIEFKQVVDIHWAFFRRTVDISLDNWPFILYLFAVWKSASVSALV
jgi:hypothetical protein